MKPFMSLLLVLSLPVLTLAWRQSDRLITTSSFSGANQSSKAASPMDVTVISAGDIVDCAKMAGSEETAKLLDKLPGTILPVGDLAYPDGSEANFQCYDKTWGRHKD